MLSNAYLEQESRQIFGESSWRRLKQQQNVRRRLGHPRMNFEYLPIPRQARFPAPKGLNAHGFTLASPWATQRSSQMESRPKYGKSIMLRAVAYREPFRIERVWVVENYILGRHAKTEYDCYEHARGGNEAPSVLLRISVWCLRQPCGTCCPSTSNVDFARRITAHASGAIRRHSVRAYYQVVQMAMAQIVDRAKQYWGNTYGSKIRHLQA